MAVDNQRIVGKKILHLQAELGLNSRQFSILAGIDPATINKIEKGKLGLSINNAKSIGKAFGIDLKWLVDDGEDIDKLTINSYTPKNEAETIGAPKLPVLDHVGLVQLSDGRYIMNTPLINKKAYAGYLVGWGDDEYMLEQPIHPIIVEQAHRGEYVSFEVKGDSMDDGSATSIQDGDIATGRKIQRSHWKSKLHITKFKEFIIVTTDGILVKEVIGHNIETGVITCRSYNEDKAAYPDFEINLDDVMQIFNVVQVTKKRR